MKIKKGDEVRRLNSADRNIYIVESISNSGFVHLENKETKFVSYEYVQNLIKNNLYKYTFNEEKFYKFAKENNIDEKYLNFIDDVRDTEIIVSEKIIQDKFKLGGYTYNIKWFDEDKPILNEKEQFTEDLINEILKFIENNKGGNKNE